MAGVKVASLSAGAKGMTWQGVVRRSGTSSEWIGRQAEI